MRKMMGVSAAVLTLGLIGCGTQNTSHSTVGGASYLSDALRLDSAQVRYEPVLDAYIFTMRTLGDAASVTPVPAGQVDGAPVIGYVFTTDLAPQDIGFGNVAGTVALAVTSHPDFDDTPLWDEDNNENYDDDGIVYHSHWVVLEENAKASAGLAVVQASSNTGLKPTSPMPMYLDSPGFTVLEKDEQVSVVVPLSAVKRNTDFTTQALTAYMEVDASGASPLLKVERVYDSLDWDLSIEQADLAPTTAWPTGTTVPNDASFDITQAEVDYLDEIESLVFTMTTAGDAAVQVPQAIGEVNGATVLGYVFPTTIDPANVGFKNIEDATLALAVTTHPDFDDTPLWDENGDNNFSNDGVVYHTHWVALVQDADSGAGLSVPSSESADNLPPTAPMPMYLDSPNFHAHAQGNKIRVIVPSQRVNGVSEFNFDAVTARMNVDATGAAPVLRVNEVFEVLSENLTLPYAVTEKQLSDY